MRFDLPEGNWIDVYDPRKMPESKRRILKRAQMNLASVPGVTEAVQAAQSTGVDLDEIDPLERMGTFKQYGVDLAAFGDAQDVIKDQTILAYVHAWSFGDVTADVLASDVITAEIFDALDEAIGTVAKATGGPDLDVSVRPEMDSPTAP